ncbi:YkvA family protein [Geitlerinema sp. PCC 7407]|uniref:YkvA family protein n=1 Tax=Geitlerinema sp. PCC 7407 TaxID=1173025 RepID=UPI00029FE8A8|nr:YkvA family protein [Geitlerinema sp. PCC 7407]AFY64605.1 protein of unknown function DUF1232 [Geitlerinema sp. PCC 7407]
MKFSPQSFYNWYRETLRNPKYRWWIVLGSLFYLFMPFDFLPDFIPGVGQLDDVAIMMLLVSEVSQMMIEGFKTRQATRTVANSGVSSPDEAVDVEAETVS